MIRQLAFSVGISISFQAIASDGSHRPLPRPDGVQLASVISSVRPQIRRAVEPSVVQISSAAGFDAWTTDFRERALAQGISQTVFERAFKGVRYDPEVIKRDRNQSEFTKTLWDYLDTAASEARVNNGKKAISKQRDTLQKIEGRFGVDKEVVAAIWGLESAYGTFRGSKDLIGSLATLAFDGRRGPFFESQLIAALKIIQAGDVAPRKMTGSWAGAMGHTQFMPTSYLEYAVDFTGDNKRDIWSDDPTDALASTAAYLEGFGWVTGQPWGVEISVPEGFDYLLANRTVKKSPPEWAQLGIRGIDGLVVPDHGVASILLPAGARGAAFMIFKNFEVIERYNTADAYVIGVGHLSDRLKGGSKIQSDWPRGDRALTFDERIELQKLLSSKGFDTVKIDAKIGPLTIEAVRGFQKSIGIVPDGYASLDLLKRLR